MGPGRRKFWAFERLRARWWLFVPFLHISPVHSTERSRRERLCTRPQWQIQLQYRSLPETIASFACACEDLSVFASCVISGRRLVLCLHSQAFALQLSPSLSTMLSLFDVFHPHGPLHFRALLLRQAPEGDHASLLVPRPEPDSPPTSSLTLVMNGLDSRSHHAQRDAAWLTQSD